MAGSLGADATGTSLRGTGAGVLAAVSTRAAAGDESGRRSGGVAVAGGFTRSASFREVEFAASAGAVAVSGTPSSALGVDDGAGVSTARSNPDVPRGLSPAGDGNTASARIDETDWIGDRPATHPIANPAITARAPTRASLNLRCGRAVTGVYRCNSSRTGGVARGFAGTTRRGAVLSKLVSTGNRLAFSSSMGRIGISSICSSWR
jgi:hypothetical protein